ncbi:hypothetical protein [Nocardioides plantarum]|uniref:Uncharacterized protein n=1 Tax=Nocardioides plantarum TaxID=29299 RepID=A0ABV5K407_9ACTN|nr:hypothetical protein [Nocardioides plantarum]
MTENEKKEAATLDQRRAARVALKTRHSQSVVRLMDERADLRGVHPLADFVDESVRWTA